MTISPALQRLYASGGPDTRIQTLTIEMPSGEHVRLVNDFTPIWLGVDGQMQEFEPCGMEIDLPAKDNSGNQTLQFILGVLDDDRINNLIISALESAEMVFLVYREYISIDTSAPARSPIRMNVVGGSFQANQLGVEGSYFDMLNTRWPRESYTIELAPGLKWM